MTIPTFLTVPGAPTPIAPFRHAVEADGWVFVTGQMQTWPRDDDRPPPEGIEAQTRRVMDNLVIVLQGAGLELANVVCVRVYLTHFDWPDCPYCPSRPARDRTSQIWLKN